MPSSKCPKYESCSAPLCPLENNDVSSTWFNDEDICKAKKFQTLGWVKKQRAIAKLKASPDKYFTIEMLKAIRRVSKFIEGIELNTPFDKAEVAEKRWIEARKSGAINTSGNRKKKDITVVGNDLTQTRRGLHQKQTGRA